MDDLCDLLAGAQINKQHPYFNMAKNDIERLVNQYIHYIDYDSTNFLLLNAIKTAPDLYQLNIVIQYIITFGNSLFRAYIENKIVVSYNKIDYEQYLNEYVDELTVFISKN